LSDQSFSISELLSLVTSERSEPDNLRRHLLFRDPRARFSIQAIQWGAGQTSAIHDHLAWCVAGVYQGEQLETLYDFRPTRQEKVLVPISRECKRRGDVTHFAATKTNIHQVENSGTETAVSIHVYGVDIQKVGSSVRQSYSLDSVLS
jgi:predicted metal-dependent enzyme (double-stranded beta helix superfamily)